ncbi:MAG: calcium-binding protein [Antarcticimicrobium sp.]|uniref:calcium-binding protein n=1 Tax=Antarcticimicrobium sp. TaxID=2824147 RepID=UPI0026137AC7|nr:calcium-binding protein [Antarcticimicrobium sp.]MDF1716194.1 calcium-binding protein [Antarcticimicrobium sp.]
MSLSELLSNVKFPRINIFELGEKFSKTEKEDIRNAISDLYSGSDVAKEVFDANSDIKLKFYKVTGDHTQARKFAQKILLNLDDLDFQFLSLDGTLEKLTLHRAVMHEIMHCYKPLLFEKKIERHFDDPSFDKMGDVVRWTNKIMDELSEQPGRGAYQTLFASSDPVVDYIQFWEPYIAGEFDAAFLFLPKNPKSINLFSSENGVSGGRADSADLVIAFEYSNKISTGDGNDGVVGAGKKDIVFAGSGRDVVYGQDGADILKGGKGRDFLFGGKGKDQLQGGSGWDTLVGGEKKDKIYGQGGDDDIWGGKGNDNLWGGGGSDRFLLRNDRSADTIMDFQIGKDRIIVEKNIDWFEVATRADETIVNLYDGEHFEYRFKLDGVFSEEDLLGYLWWADVDLIVENYGDFWLG